MEGKARFEVFRDSKGDYRWHFRSTNNQIIATAGEGYRCLGCSGRSRNGRHRLG